MASGEVDPARVGYATARHWALCARLAVVLERREGWLVWGEPRLRGAEHEAGGPVASAQRGVLPDGRPRLRRPDLVLFPRDGTALPVAVEVELSVKAAGRLDAICRAWARCRLVSEVRYYAPPHVARAISRAVSAVHAHDAIRILSLEEALKEAADVRFVPAAICRSRARRAGARGTPCGATPTGATRGGSGLLTSATPAAAPRGARSCGGRRTARSPTRAT